MSTQENPMAAEPLRLGPIKAVRVYTAPPPSDRRVVDSVGHETVPFDEIRHLIAAKPLRRLDQTDSDTDTAVSD
ncbi:MAG: hypothetical protein IH888_04650 [Planctomycetes bacterium]|nr:hypothetical protein [Planctomycetota bacterium]